MFVFVKTLSKIRCYCVVFLVTAEGRVFGCGEGTNGRLGLGSSANISNPKLLQTLQQHTVKKIAVHSGIGSHVCLKSNVCIAIMNTNRC